MSRQHPLFSRLGCLGGLVLILGIVAAIWLTGGEIFSPGLLTAWAEEGKTLQGFQSHAEFEPDCQQCHAPFVGLTAERCEACHTSVQAERAAGQGLHGRLDTDEAAQCGTCHRDHQGRDYNPHTVALKKFDHATIGFSLARHLTDYDATSLECRACHNLPQYDFILARCVDCHAQNDPAFMEAHTAAFGGDCLACHDGVDQTSAFDHAQTDFPLDGAHAEQACTACHNPNLPPADTPTECQACHAEPALHAGVFATDCATCHSPAAWSPANLPQQPAFAHTQTAFQLIHHRQDFNGAPLTCAACHTGAAFIPTSTESCVACHGSHDQAFMTQHVQDFGLSCVGCHDGTGNMKDFDHHRVFALEGRHAELECAACHIDQQFRGTPGNCVDCHQEPEAHAGVFGLNCAACHTAAAWAPARLTQHTFPLDHGEQGEIACATCHTASYTQQTCYGCHEHDPGETQARHAELNLSADELNDCAACHPTGREAEEGER